MEYMSCLICQCNCSVKSPGAFAIHFLVYGHFQCNVILYWLWSAILLRSWVIPGYWGEWQFRSWSSTSDVSDKSLQTTIFVDPSSVGKSPLIQVRWPELLMILKWEKTLYNHKIISVEVWSLFSLSEFQYPKLYYICERSQKFF